MMDIPITRASAYLRRNRTTHSWYGDWNSPEGVMSHSCPTPRTLEDHMMRARATRPAAPPAWQRGSRGSDISPIVIRAKSQDRGAAPSSSASSPGPFSSSSSSSLQVPKVGFTGVAGLLGERPSSAYSYDGGFFVTANTPDKDFFVIHPEWVSETETLKQLSRKRESNLHVNQSQAPPTLITWKSYKRSKSAPPCKFRNPITWVD